MEINLDNKIIRKFSSEYRYRLGNKISKLREKKDFVSIFNLIQLELGQNISINRNGIFFNMNALSDDCIENINDFLNKINENIVETDTKIKYKSYSVDELENINSHVGPKLSNQEKSILKKFHKI